MIYQWEERELEILAGTKAAAERAAKEFAFATEAAEKESARSTNFQIMNSAITDAAANSRSAAEAQLKVAQRAVELGVEIATQDRALLNREIELQFQANHAHAIKESRTFGKLKTDGTYELIQVKTTEVGDMVFKGADDMGQPIFEKIPDGYAELTATNLTAMAANGKIDMSEGTPKSIMVPDAESPTGFTQKAGVYVGGQFFIAGEGNEFTLAPEGFFLGKADDIQAVVTDKVGRTFIIPKTGPLAGRKTLVSVNNEHLGPLAHELFEPKYKTDEQGEIEKDPEGRKTLLSGNPFVQVNPNPGISFAQLSPTQVELYQKEVLGLSTLLQTMDDVLGALNVSIGPENRIMSFLSNNVAAFTPDAADEILNFTDTQRARAEKIIELSRKNLAKAFALSDRYAFGEQEINRALVDDVLTSFFTNPKVAIVRAQELFRGALNDLNEKRAILGDTQPRFLNQIPSGSENDPFFFSGKGHMDYINILAANDAPGLDGLHIVMSGERAKKEGLPPSVWYNNPEINMTVGQFKQYRKEGNQ